MNLQELSHKIRRKWTKFRLQPIRVLCFHQTSETYDPDVYCKPDWIPLSFLKDYVKLLQSRGYEFITLEEAHRHVRYDYFRTHKYAVLTADDGLLCQASLLPWLEEQHIPITMFLNIKNLDGKTCGEPEKNFFHITNEQEESLHASKLYCTKEQLFALSSPMLSIGMHGLTHDKVTSLTKDEFVAQLLMCRDTLNVHPAYIPYFAYPYGIHSMATDKELHTLNIVPVYADGCVNYNDSSVIHRVILEHIYQCQNHQS